MNRYIQKFISNIILLHTLLVFVMLIFFDCILSYQKFLSIKASRESLLKRLVGNIELSIKTTGIYQSKPQDIVYIIIDNKGKAMGSNINITKEIKQYIIKNKKLKFYYAGLLIKKAYFEDATLGKLQIIAGYSLNEIYNSTVSFFGIIFLISIFIAIIYYRISYVLSEKWSIPLLSLYRTTEEFLNTVAHEVLTPISYISIISDDDEIKNSINRVKNILNGILEIKKFDVLKTPSDFINTEIVINTVLQEMFFAINERKINLEKELISNRINTYQNIFYILVRNLIDNAIKHNIENGVISIKSDIIGKYYHLRIDNSCSPQETQSSTQMHFGKGLGLYIIYKALSILKGNIDISKDKNVFKVIITLPL